jgi:hypothetical protein
LALIAASVTCGGSGETGTGGHGATGTTATGGGTATGNGGATTTTTTTTGSGGATTTTGTGGAGTGGGGSSPCPAGVTCVTTFPFHDDRDTSVEGMHMIDTYACKPGADESGPEIVYRVTVPEPGFLSVAVYSDPGVDIDVHILSSLDGNACLDRGDVHARADVPAGDVWIVADTYVSGGIPQSGAFGLDIGFIVPSKGPCGMEVGEMPRVGDNGNHLAMPATGPIVMEAHLVTQAEPPPYPMTATDELEAHYQLSQAATGLVMYRTQVWAPLEGGSFYGAGIGDPSQFPVVDEGWYVNMYWTAAARPAKGTRMILKDPSGGRAVVVAAGYETGPGNLAHIGGTPEESHFYMGTRHLDPMTLGIATDQTLPLGPRICE